MSQLNATPSVFWPVTCAFAHHEEESSTGTCTCMVISSSYASLVPNDNKRHSTGEKKG